MSRQRQNFGAVGQVTRAMVVLRPRADRDFFAFGLRQRRAAGGAIAFGRSTALHGVIGNSAFARFEIGR
jgi:hypothetical protein